MTQGFVSRRVTAAFAIAVLTLGAIANGAISALLKDGDKITGAVAPTSGSYQFRTMGRGGSTNLRARGEEHTFAASRGDRIEISVVPEPGSRLRPMVVLFDPTGRQVAFNDNPQLVAYQVVRPGTYRLLVLGRNNSVGRYALEIDGMSPGVATNPSPSPTPSPTPIPGSQADQVMQDVLKLRVIGCGVPNVARIQIGTEERCTRDIDVGQYTYDAASRSIKLVDPRRDLVASRLQLSVLDRCPTPATNVAQITLTDPQDGRDYTYCAVPSRFVQAGNYRYNPTTDALTPLASTPNPIPSPMPTPTPGPITDSRRQMLQSEYGLMVLDSCPVSRTSLVVVNFQEGNQIYQYCANPNRLVRAVDYTYNASTGNLDANAKPTNCTVSVGGICVIK